MKKLLTKISIYGVTGIIPAFFLVGYALAAGQNISGVFSNPFGGGGVNSIPEFLDKLIDVLINFGAVVVIFFVVFAGFRFVMAQGNPEKIKNAKSILMYTLIGGAILLGAKVISEAIKSTVEQFGQ